MCAAALRTLRGRLARRNAFAAVLAIPRRNAMAPPQLARDAPVVNVAHPLEIRLGVILGNELDLAVFDRFDGATFKREQLMDKFGIQINKTSRNTVLFMTNIGTTRSAVAYLIEVLVTIARDLEDGAVEMSPAQQAAQARAVLNQTAPCAPLPDFSGFHPAFLSGIGRAHV